MQRALLTAKPTIEFNSSNSSTARSWITSSSATPAVKASTTLGAERGGLDPVNERRPRIRPPAPRPKVRPQNVARRPPSPGSSGTAAGEPLFEAAELDERPGPDQRPAQLPLRLDTTHIQSAQPTGQRSRLR